MRWALINSNDILLPFDNYCSVVNNGSDLNISTDDDDAKKIDD